jgi:hypothetical protein
MTPVFPFVILIARHTPWFYPIDFAGQKAYKGVGHTRHTTDRLTGTLTDREKSYVVVSHTLWPDVSLAS